MVIASGTHVRSLQPRPTGRRRAGTPSTPRAEALRTTVDELKAGQALMTGMHAREFAVARHDALAAQQAVAELHQGKARGLLARLGAAVSGR